MKEKLKDYPTLESYAVSVIERKLNEITNGKKTFVIPSAAYEKYGSYYFKDIRAFDGIQIEKIEKVENKWMVNGINTNTHESSKISLDYFSYSTLEYLLYGIEEMVIWEKTKQFGVVSGELMFV